MLRNHHHSRVCRKRHKKYSQAQRVFKTAPLYAQTNPEEAAPQSVLDAFAAFFESLWSPSTNPDGSNVQKACMSYVYDEDGTLIAQTLTGGAQSSWGQSARYVYLPTASGPMPVAAIYGTKHYAIQSDHLNTPRRLIQSDGQVAWQWAYSAFGDEKPTVAKNRFANLDLNQSFGTSTVPAVTFNLRYPGQYFDQESGLHYNYHRSYSATTGRYTQADPIGLDGGWNRYGYVGGNPLSYVDPKGLDWSTSGSMTICWFFGTCQRNVTFGPGSSPVSEMKNAHGVNAARALYNRKNQNKTECDCAGALPVTNFAASFGLSGLFAAGLNPTQQFVGSYRVDIYPVEGCKKKFIITNTSSFKSFAYGIGPDWEGGMMGNTSQTYWWIE